MATLGLRGSRLPDDVHARLLPPGTARSRTVALAVGGRVVTVRVLGAASATEPAVVLFPAGEGPARRDRRRFGPRAGGERRGRQ